MKPLLFILFMVALGIIIALQFGKEATWFNYYAGSIAGLLVSGLVLEFFVKRKRKKELEETKKKRGRQGK